MAYLVQRKQGGSEAVFRIAFKVKGGSVQRRFFKIPSYKLFTKALYGAGIVAIDPLSPKSLIY